MANEDLLVKIKADIKSLQAGLRQAVRESDKAGKAMGEGLSKGPNKALNDLKKNFSSIDAFARLPTFLGGLAAVQAGRALVNINLEYERVANTLKAVTGSSELAAEEMAFLTREADRLGVSITATAINYAQFLASVKGTKLEGQAARDIFLSIVEASGKLGLSNEKTEKALLAVTQMMSKGTVSAEELRGQLGDALPIAFATMARAAGVTTAELGDMLKEGKVISEEILPKFAEELRKTLGTDATTRIETNAAGFARLRNEIGLLANEVGGPLANALADAAEGFSKFLKRGRENDQFEVMFTSVTQLENRLARLRKEQASGWQLPNVEAYNEKIRETEAQLNKIIDAQQRWIKTTVGGIMAPFQPKPITGADVQIPRMENPPDPKDVAKRLKEQEAAAKKAAAAMKAETDARVKASQDAIKAARESVMTQIELEQYKYDMQRAILEKSNASMFGGTEQKNKMLEQLAQKHAMNVAAIEIDAAKEAEERRANAVSAAQRQKEEFAQLEEQLYGHNEIQLLQEQDAYAKRLEALELYHQQTELLDTEYAAIRERLESEHFKNMNDIRASELTSGLQMLAGIKDREKRLIADRAASTIATMATFSKKAFEINKAVNIAQASIDMYKAIQKARAEGGPFLGPVLAGFELAAGLANIAAIKKTQFGGGGASGAVAGAANPNNTTPPPGQGGQGGGVPQIMLNLAPGRYSEQDIRNLVDQINSAYDDGARVR